MGREVPFSATVQHLHNPAFTMRTVMMLTLAAKPCVSLVAAHARRPVRALASGGVCFALPLGTRMTCQDRHVAVTANLGLGAPSWLFVLANSVWRCAVHQCQKSQSERHTLKLRRRPRPPRRSSRARPASSPTASSSSTTAAPRSRNCTGVVECGRIHDRRVLVFVSGALADTRISRVKSPDTSTPTNSRRPWHDIPRGAGVRGVVACIETLRRIANRNSKEERARAC